MPVDSEPGLTDAEFDRLEQQFDFTFADDHRAYLAAGLPLGAGWPNWRSGGRALQKQLQLPVDGILYAVEWTEFWHDAWGPRPARMKDALRSAKYHLARAPKLLPVFSHHYLPSRESHQPVLSVVRTDVSVVGVDLADYLERDASSPVAATCMIEFWSSLIS